MADYINLKLDGDKLQSMSALGLAHIGDAVFELMVRSWLCSRGTVTAKKMHGRTVEYVSAKSQAASIERLLPGLTDGELAVFKRGRNAHVNSVPRGSTYEEYHLATGFEALFGYLYLSGAIQRLNELFEQIVAERKEA